jgi:hypothetical protein
VLDMPELNIFDGGLAERVFLIGSMVFIALYAAGILFLRRRGEVRINRVALHGRAAGIALFVAAAVSAAAGGLGPFNVSPSDAANKPVSLSIDALHSAVDTR